MTNEPATTLDELTKQFAALMDACEKVMHGSSDAAVQAEQIAALDVYVKQIKAYKWNAISQCFDDIANRLFHFQCMAQAVRAYLQVWVDFKDGEFQKAWSSLIDANEYSGVAAKAFDADGTRVLVSRLVELERALFPSFGIYFSAGFTETVGNCSICRQGFGRCDHLENHVYAGRLCLRVDRKIIKVDHFSMVDTPRDRRCIIPEIENDDAMMVSRFTHLVVGPAGDEVDKVEPGRRVRGVMLNFSSLDFD